MRLEVPSQQSSDSQNVERQIEVLKFATQKKTKKETHTFARREKSVSDWAIQLCGVHFR